MNVPFEVRSSGPSGVPLVLVVFVAGELDLETAPALRRTLDEALNEACQVVLDLSAVQFIDAHSVGVLIGAVNQAEKVGGDICVRSPSRIVQRLWALLQLDGILPIED